MNNKAILIVEDDPDDIDLIKRALLRNSVVNEVVIVEDGAAALDLFFKKEGRFAGKDSGMLPAVVLLDIKLPKVGGFEVLRRLRAEERTRLLPVVILTSSIEEEDLVNGYRCGANSYVRKPVEFESFVTAMQHLTVYWLLLNEMPPPR